MKHQPTRRRRRPIFVVVAALIASTAVVAVPQAAFAEHDTKTLDVTPETGTVAGGSLFTLTATLSSAATSLTEIDFEIEGGPNDPDSGVSPATPDITCQVAILSASCTASYTPAFLGSDTIRAWIHHTGADRTTEADATEGQNEAFFPGAVAEPDRTDVVTVLVTSNAPGAQVLDCDDELPSGAGNDTEVAPTTGADAATHVTYTCVVSVQGTGVANVVVDAENLTAGVNDSDAGKVAPPDYTCTTGTNGTCTFDVPIATGTLTAGTALICAWIDSNNDNAIDDTNANNGGGCGEAVGATENDNGTDVMQVTWQNRVVTTIDILNEDDSRIISAGQTTFTANLKATDQFGDGIGAVPIDLYVLGGPNRNTGSVVNRECTTIAAGTCSITYTSNGSNGIDKFCAWRDADPADVYNATGPIGDGGGCAAEPEAPGTDGGDPLTDRGQVTWSGGASVPTDLQVTPEAPSGNLAQGTEHSLTANVKDENGNPMNNQVVNFEIIGAGDPDNGDSPTSPDRTCTTGTNGSCSLQGSPGALGSSTTFSSNVSGSTTIRAWVNGTTADLTEGPDAGDPPDEPAGGPNQPGGTIEPDTTDVVRVQWGFSSTTLSASVSPDVGVYGVDPVISGTLLTDGSPLAGALVTVTRSYVGSTASATVGTATTAANGTYSIQDQDPFASADYQATFAGDSTHLAATSGLQRLGIRPGVIFNSSATSLPKGRSVQLSGAVIPAHPGRKVWLQRLDGPSGQWLYVREVVLDGNGRYQFYFSSNGNYCLLFRIAYPTQDVDHLWNVSRNQRTCWS